MLRGNDQSIRIYYCVLGVLLLAGCQTTDDPREGGFIGGVGGLSSGAYEQRIREREQSLDRLQGIQVELDAQRAELEYSQQESLSAYRAEQQRIAEMSKNKLENSGKFQKPIVTEITPAPEFYKAEEYHQKYFQKRGLS